MGACVGDEDDINTLYEMVREAQGDSVYLRQGLEQEREQRAREQVRTDRLERLPNEFVDGAMPAAGSLGLCSREPSRSLDQCLKGVGRGEYVVPDGGSHNVPNPCSAVPRDRAIHPPQEVACHRSTCTSLLWRLS